MILMVVLINEICSILSRINSKVMVVERSVEAISWKPKAFIYHNFLSSKECQYLIDAAKPHMQRSRVYDKLGKVTISSSRTSTSTSLDRGSDETIREIERGIVEFTFIPVEHGEGLHIIRYQVGQKILPHYDYFTDNKLFKEHTKNGGDRVATMVMYLSDVKEGGETMFPKGEKREVRVKPKMGDALFFWNMKPDATVDPSSLHTGCPVIRGNKWLSIKFMRVNEYKLA